MENILLAATIVVICLAGLGIWGMRQKFQKEFGQEREEAKAHIAELKEAQEELAKLTEQNYILHEINKTINACHDQDEIVTIILQALVTITGAETSTIMLYDPKDDPPVKIVTACGFDQIEAIIESFNTNYGTTIAWQVLQSGEPYVNMDRTQYQKFVPSINYYVTSVPMLYGKEVIGAVNIHTMGKNYELTESKMEFLYILAGQAALAVKNTSMYRQLKRQSDFFEKQALTDGLTGLYNHIFFQQRMEEEMDRARRYQSDLCLLLFDIDHFKSFNDRYGHPFGDVVLKEVACLVQQNIRSTDLAARYGGEEFAVILPNTPVKGARQMAERMRKAVERHLFENEEGTIKSRVTVSIGVGHWDREIAKMPFIEMVDQALYQAKRTGRNRVCVGAIQPQLKEAAGAK